MRLFLTLCIIALPLLAACGDDIDLHSTALRINEVSSMGTDFIEIYNTSDQPFTIEAGKWRVTDSRDNEHSLWLNARTIPGRGFLVVFPDRVTLPYGAPVGSQLSPPDGLSKFGLAAADSAKLFFDGKLVDVLDWTAPIATYGQYPDGSESWAILAPTPGQANGTFPTLTGMPLVINEVCSTNHLNPGGGDFIEIYNTNTLPLAIGTNEWFVTDAGIQPIYLSATTIPGNGYLVINTLQSNLSFGLGNADKARLFRVVNSTNFLVDEVSWSANVYDLSRVPDGTGGWVSNQWEITPGVTNTSLGPGAGYP